MFGETDDDLDVVMKLDPRSDPYPRPLPAEVRSAPPLRSNVEPPDISGTRECLPC